MFEMELRKELTSFLEENNLVEIKEDCPNYYELIRWLDRYTVKSYEIGAYEMPRGQKVLIDLFIGRITQKQQMWEISYSEINCIGSADKQLVTAIPLDKNKTGVNFSPKESFVVYYDGCNGESFTSLIPVELGSTSINSIGNDTNITDNCGLSATRSFVVAKYIKNKLNNNTKIYYSAEGAIGKAGDNPESRRVRIEITFVGAKKVSE